MTHSALLRTNTRVPVYEEDAAPVGVAELDPERRVSLRHFRDTRATVDHPPLRDNILSIHLGGPKRISRSAGNRSSIREVDVNALTIIPAQHAYRWRTEGPIDFAHLTLPAGILHQVAWEEFGCAPAELTLHETLGFRSPLIEQALLALVADMSRTQPGRLYRDGLLTALTYVLLRDHSTLGARHRGLGSRPLRGGLAVHALSRVVAYMETHLAEDIDPADLIAQTGLSRAQFYRGFKQSTGLTPRAYLATLRRSRARILRAHAGVSAEEAASLVGLASPVE